MNPDSRTAIVTGGASGLGRAVCEELARHGTRVAIFDRNIEAGEALATQLGAQQALFTAVDVTSETSVTAGIAKTIATFGAIHICVNCAGVADAAKTVGDGKPFPLDVWQKVIAVNLTGTFNVLRLAALEMAKNSLTEGEEERGVIVNISSGAASDGQMGQAAYSASKAGVIGMTMPIARDLADLGIRCVAVAPGLFDTPMVAGIPKKVSEAIVNKMILFPRRMGAPEEVAQLVRSIIENPYINATCVHIDAGARMGTR